MISEASALQSRCHEARLSYPEIALADSLLKEAETFIARGNEKKAYYPMDHAVVLYQIALMSSRLEQSERRIKELETALKVTRAKLATYEKTLEELPSVEQP